MASELPTYVLTLSCPDHIGVVADVAAFLVAHDCNIIESGQFSDSENGQFYLRNAFQPQSGKSLEALKAAFAPIAEKYAIKANFYDAASKVKTLVLVSKLGHCLNDLLFRWKSGLLAIDVRAIISNHRDFYQLAASYNVPFHHIPVTAATKAQGEAKQLEIIEAEGADLVVLARYMQILSNDLCVKLAGRAINIHHSFLPSFKGAKPYYQAHDRGVKLIGATAHYVTADLDEGPIIEQDVERADHTDTVEDLTARGRDTESQVLARAVKWHSEHRVLLNGHRTVVFR